MSIFNLFSKKTKSFIQRGKLLKNKITEAALKLDPELLALLLADKEAKQRFFTQVSDVAVFDKIKFQKFINNKQFLADSYTSFKKIGLSANDQYLR